MIDQSTFIPFEQIFPQVKGKKPLTRVEIIKLARKVATALEKESEQLAAKEKQPDPPSTRFFCQT